MRLTTADSKVVTIGGRDVLMVKRFDRKKAKAGYQRARMISALTLLRADESIQSRHKWSYNRLVEELRRISVDPKKDAAELFRRMCFNALISNTDDHRANHAIVAKRASGSSRPRMTLHSHRKRRSSAETSP